MKSLLLPSVSASRRLLSLASFCTAAPLILVGLVSPALAAPATITYSNTAVTSSSVSSTSGSSSITVPSGTWAVGDAIYFSGTTATTNPFGTSVNRYYVVSASGSTLQVATTPGGTPVIATNTTTVSTITQGIDWFTSANWTGGTVPNDSGTIASFGTGMTAGGSNTPVVVNGAATVYGLTFGGSTNGDLLLTSGANGTGLYALTFATNDSTTPTLSLTSGSNAIIALGSSSSGSMKLAIAGTQGLIFNSSAGGALTGSGTTATSTAPGKQIRLQNIDWSGFSGGLQIQRGFIQLSTANQLPGTQSLTVGNAQTLTNNLLAGLNMNGQNGSVDALNGNSLGRVWGAGTLTVGSANGSGNYGGDVGLDFTGASSATVITKTGTGTQTFSGVVGGTGAVNVNAGTVTYDSAAVSTTANTTVASGATLTITSTTGNVSQGTGANAGRIIISSGGTLNGTGTLALSDTNGGLTGVSMGGTFTPGTATTIGTFTVNAANSVRSAWSFESTGVLSFKLGAGVTADKFAVVGGAATNDVFFTNNTINFTDLTAGSLATGDYLLVSGDANTAYSGLTLGSSYTGASVTGTAITGGLTIGTGLSAYTNSQLFLVGTNIYLNVTASAIPEPSACAALAGLGLLGFAVWRRRRQA